jgi:hypothetical protein
MSSDEKTPDQILADPNHIVWKIMLLCVLILGGGSVVGGDIVSIAGL